MKILHDWWSRIRALFGGAQLDREMDEEWRSHLERETERYIAQGYSRAEAARQARLHFGGLDQLKEREREARGISWLETLGRDVRYGCRMLRKHPGFTTVAVLTLALGLSANITVFGMISHFFFRPLPVQNAERLVVMARQNTDFGLATPLSWMDFEDFRRDVPEFSDAAGVLFRPAHLGLPGQTPDRVYIEAVSGNYFEMLGVQPGQGRLFLPDEGQAIGRDPVAVLNYDYWQSKLGANPNVVGETLMINGQPFRIIGITPSDFTSAQWSLLPSAYIPATMVPVAFPGTEGAFHTRDWPMFKVFGLLRPGATARQAQATVDVVHQRLAREHRTPEEELKARTIVRPERLSRPDPSVAGIVPFAATVFMSLMGLVLLIACANVANLMFSRALSRQREMGVRSALGASRGRLTRQLMTESMLLALLAGAAGFLLSYWGAELLAQFEPSGDDMPLKVDRSWDWNLVWYTVGVSFVAGLLMSIVPARRATDVDVQAAVKGASVQSRRYRSWFRHGLVVTQVGFSVIVLACGGLFLRSLLQLTVLDLGFRSEGVIMASFDPALNNYTEERSRALVDGLLDRVRALPTVDSATVATHVPLAESFDLRPVWRAIDHGLAPAERSDREVQVGLNRVSRDYFECLGVVLQRGRVIGREDTATSVPAVVVNQALVDRLWPDQDPIGQELIISDGVARQVVGVVPTGKYVMLGEQARPYVWVPLTQLAGSPLILHVRSHGDPTVVGAQLRQVVRQFDEALPIYNVLTMEEHLRTSVFGYMPLRFAAWLAAVQGGLGLFLAVMGIYGVVAYSVTQRTREIGVRMALGAAPADVLRLVMGGGFRLTLIGLLVGLTISVGVAQVLSGLLYGLNPLDPMVFGSIIVILVSVSGLACYLPARRAFRVDPMIALRSE